jgi:hypothetical protein
MYLKIIFYILELIFKNNYIYIFLKFRMEK